MLIFNDNLCSPNLGTPPEKVHNQTKSFNAQKQLLVQSFSKTGQAEQHETLTQIIISKCVNKHKPTPWHSPNILLMFSTAQMVEKKRRFSC